MASLAGEEISVLLAGDIGGTKTALAFFDAERGPVAPRTRTLFASQEYPSLEAIVREFCADHRGDVTHACFAVAGPVANGRAKITNLPWIVDAAELAKELGGIPVTLLNDLEATALSIPLLAPGEIHTLASGEAKDRQTVAVVAPGTGLGEAFLTWEGDRPRAHPSEGGHSDFAPANDVQAALLAYLRQRHGHVSVERACSGNAIPDLYEFLRDSGRAGESNEIRRRLQGVEDRTPVIVTAAMEEPPDPLCSATMELFVDILGAEAGNLALKVLSGGGVYLGGGIPKRIVKLLSGPRFLDAFVAKGRMAELLAAMPVHVVLTQTALRGSASLGLHEMGARAGAPRAAGSRRDARS
jgi:glucokinase